MKYTRLWESNLPIGHLVNADNSRALRKLRKEKKELCWSKLVCFTSNKWKRRVLDTVDIWEKEQCY